jgi:CHAD domain-containing protein
MAFTFDRGRTVQENVRVIASSQLKGALDDIDDPDLGIHETVHEVRKSCKKVRGLLRLTRLGAEELFDRENAALRDAARRISDLRDLTANLETVALLEDRFVDALEEELLAGLRKALEERRVTRAAELDLADRIEKVREEIEATLDRSRGWEISGKGFGALAGGLGKTYRRAVNRMHDAFDEPSSEAWHEWRKRVKYHRYHTDLLQGVWEPVLDARERQLHDLTDLLGDDHDLWELRRVLREEPRWLDDDETGSTVIGLIDRLRAELQGAARPLALRLFAEAPDDLVARYRSYWKAWHAGPTEVHMANPVIQPGG